MKFFNHEILKSHPQTLPEDHWFKITERLYKESGEIPDPLQIRANAIIDALGIPAGQYSALETNQEDKRINPEKDKIIAEYLTNKAGVLIDKEVGITSSDFRDIYPEGLPSELKKVLDPAVLSIMEVEYEHAKKLKRSFFGDTKKLTKADCSVNYFRLPGGIDLFLRGYFHDKKWQKNHGWFFKEINKQAKVICIEGFVDKQLGMSMNLCWGDPRDQLGDYDVLMHEAVDAGFNGLFTEIDARDESKIKMDSTANGDLSFLSFPNLSPTFFDKYFDFLQKEHPNLTKTIDSPKKLKQALVAQSTTQEGFLWRKRIDYQLGGKSYVNYSYFSKEGEISLEPTFLEFGQQLFSDALAAIKLHLIAKLIADGHLEKGPIIDYEGAGHLSSKSFFLREPGYAMEVVLRTVNELMAGRVKEKGNIPEIYNVFENPEWSEIVKEIAKLAFKEVEKDDSKPTAVGPNQRQLIDQPIDFLEIYNINSEKVIPSDEEIKKIREKFKK